MAKSIRSKWRRKCRAVKRVRYGEKELERLKKTISNDPCYKADVDMVEVSKIATVVDKAAISKKNKKDKPSKSSGNTEEEEEELTMETDGKRAFNQKTMKDQNGTYPVWMHPRKIHKRKKMGKGKLKKKSKSRS